MPTKNELKFDSNYSLSIEIVSNTQPVVTINLITGNKVHGTNADGFI